MTRSIYSLPSGLFIEKVCDDDEARYYLVSKGWDEWYRGVRYCITEGEYNALLPLSTEAEE